MEIYTPDWAFYDMEVDAALMKEFNSKIDEPVL